MTHSPPPPQKTAPIPDNAKLSDLSETFKALAHPARLAIVHALANAPVCACELADIAKSTASTTSRHLTVLRHAGIIANERHGQQIFYRLTRPCVLQFMDCCAVSK